MTEANPSRILGLTAQIVCAHISGNQPGAVGLPNLIQGVYRSLSRAGQGDAVPSTPIPAVPIKKSVFPGYVVCLEDGKKLKLLKRHLQTSYGLTPKAYRAKWGLPHDYPMVAPDYANTRSKLARSLGIARRPAAKPKAPKRPQRHRKSSSR
jgi:predicted transcriptional regulator